MEVEKERLKNTIIALAEELKKNVIDVQIKNNKAVFEILEQKPHITFKDYVEFPMTKEFLERYCFDNI